MLFQVQRVVRCEDCRRQVELRELRPRQAYNYILGSRFSGVALVTVVLIFGHPPEDGDDVS